MTPPLPRWLCRGWSPRKGVQYGCYLPGSVMREGEPGGRVVPDCQCSICAQQEQAARDKATVRADRNAIRDRQRGRKFGPAPDGQDVFEGMKGDE